MNSRERTEAQKIAARLNGAKSKGPITAEGKARVAQNAVKHGLHARRVVMDNEDPEAWDRFLDALTEEWQPETVTELEAIHDLAAARWRLYRALDFETSLMDLEVAKSYDAFNELCPEGDTRMLNAVSWQALNKDGTLPAIHRQEVRLRRIIRDSTKQLEETRARREKEARQMPQQPQMQNKPEPASATPEDVAETRPQPLSNREHERPNKPETSRPGEPKVENKPGTPAQKNEHTPRNAVNPHQPVGPERIPPGSKAA